MDQPTDIPKITPAVNREEEKKHGGLAGWFSRMGIGSRGVGGVGGIGRAGLFLSKGILATKAGIIGLILVGTTVAGSVGFVGYKLFGPTSADRSDADFKSIFAAKPKSAAASVSGQGGASADGISQSLQYLVDANAKKMVPAQDQAADVAAAAKAAAVAAVAAVATPGESFTKSDNAPSQGPAAKLKSDRKFGQLGQSGGGGSGASSGSAGSGAGLLASAKGGNLSGMSASRAGGAAGAIPSARRLGGALNQAMQVRRDQASAASSAAAGKTYDGNAQAPALADAGSQGSSSGGTGPGTTSSGGTYPTVNPVSGSAGTSNFAPVPSVPGTNVTPWQSAINTALLCLAGACALLFIANMISKKSAAMGPWAKGLAIALSAVAASLGAFAVYLGALIGGGAYGQPLQGGILSLAGGFTIAASAAAIWGFASDGVLKGGPLAITMVCGGAALAALAAAYLTKPKQYPSTDFQNGWPPDWDHQSGSKTSQVPSDGILDRYLV